MVSNAGGDVEYWVEFGTTTEYGSEGPHQTVFTQENTPASVVPEFGRSLGPRKGSPLVDLAQ